MSKSTRRSMSPPTLLSPRATEPKIRTFEAPACRARRRISSRNRRRVVAISPDRSDAGAGRVEISRSAPVARMSRSNVLTDGEATPVS
jgi:hypothetical protein